MKCIICDKNIDTVKEQDGDYEQCLTCFNTYCIECSEDHIIKCDKCSESVCYSDHRECENCGMRLCQQCAIYDVNDMLHYCESCNNKEDYE